MKMRYSERVCNKLLNKSEIIKCSERLESQRKCEGTKQSELYCTTNENTSSGKDTKMKTTVFRLANCKFSGAIPKIKTNLESLKCFIWCRYLRWFSFVLISSSDKSGRFWDNPQTEQVEDLSQVSNSGTIEWVGPKFSGTMGEG